MITKIYKCFIASPGDTNEERIICDKILNEINKTIGDQFNFRIESLKWENDTRPSVGDYSQAIINNQIGNYDIFVGIMFKKFGTPTKVAGSGTEEEFDIAYNKFLNKEEIEIMFYFNDEAVKPSEVNSDELTKVNIFRKKIAELGNYYWKYEGVNQFEDFLRTHLTKLLLSKYKTNEVIPVENNLTKILLRKKFQKRFENALRIYSSQPIIWVEPILSNTNEISQNPDDNYNNKIELEDLIINLQSTIIKAPQQFGLTSLSHYLVKEAWEKDNLWIYIDSEKAKPHTIHNAVKNEVESLELKLADVKCIILDSWNAYESSSVKKLKNLCDAHKDLPIIVMQTIDDSKFLGNSDKIKIDREFNILHLLALPRNQIRQVVCEYNKLKDIGEEDIVLKKVVTDLDTLNIHRTPLNCITLLKVSEKNFDESPVNRTNMLEMVLFVLFNMDELPTYKTKPDLKDCEYVLGCFCENLIKNDIYEFTYDNFINQLNGFCKEKLIDLDVSVVFDVLILNNILVKRDLNYIFRSSYWIFYFGAKRMHNDSNFAEYIFSSKKYNSFPEIIEFYTGIDRNRKDALLVLTKDIKDTCSVVSGKVRLPENMNPFSHIQWKPTEEQIVKVQNEISENVINSGLPDSLKDQHADKSYNQIKPYNQSIQSFFEEYSLHNLIQNIKASSRALRNSDYVEPEIKKELLKNILKGWEEIAKVLFAMTPMLATEGEAVFENISFVLNSNFGSTYEERVKRIIQANPTNIVALFKEDLFSAKIGPLLYDHFKNESNDMTKHQLALLFIFTRPREWKKHIEEYIVDISKNSFYLYNTVNTLRARYRFDFLTDDEIKETSYLIKLGLAKHEFGDKKPTLTKVLKIPNKILPKREYSSESES
jgi:hypothetical protein